MWHLWGDAVITLMFTFSAAAQTTKDWRSHPHTLHFRYSTPAHWDAAQGEETWDVAWTSDGTDAWAAVSVSVPTPAYAPPGSPGYQGLDYSGDRLIVWRRGALAARYDLARERATVCDVISSHLVHPDGSVKVNGSTVDSSTSPLAADPLWAWMWYALGDGSTDTDLAAGPKPPRAQGPFRANVPLAATGEVMFGPTRTTVTLLDAGASYDPAVRALAVAGLARCDGRPVSDER